MVQWNWSNLHWVYIVVQKYCLANIFEHVQLECTGFRNSGTYVLCIIRIELSQSYQTLYPSNWSFAKRFQAGQSIYSASKSCKVRVLFLFQTILFFPCGVNLSHWKILISKLTRITVTAKGILEYDIQKLAYPSCSTPSTRV